MFSERTRTSSHSMTNRRKSDGADKAKPGKRSFLPFLRSKLKDTDAYGMSFVLVLIIVDFNLKGVPLSFCRVAVTRLERELIHMSETSIVFHIDYGLLGMRK